MTPEELEALRARVVRARGFIRASETVFTDTLADIDAALASEPPVEPPVDPPTDPEPPVDPDPPVEPPTGDVAFATSWSAGDILDGGRLFHRGGAYDGSAFLRVVDPQQAGWPDTALQINIGARDWALVGARGWRIPEIGETLTLSASVRIDLPDFSGVSNEHGLQSNVGTIEHAWQFHSPQGASAQIGLYHRGIGDAHYAVIPDDDPENIPLVLRKSLTRIGPSRVRLSGAEVIDARDGRVLANESRFLGQWGEDRNDPLGNPEWNCDVAECFGQYLFGASGSSNGSGVVLVTDFRVEVG